MSETRLKTLQEAIMPGIEGANEFTVAELELLFNGELEQETPPAVEGTGAQTDEGEGKEQKPAEPEVDKTKAFAKRLKESTDKVRQEEREAIAKSLGYESYEQMIKERETKKLEEKGIDPEQGSEVIDELVKQRIEADPRIKELEEYRKQRVKEFGERELAEINKLTNGEITSLAQLPKEVIDLWKTKGSLKAAYLELEGEKLITKIRSEQSKGSTGHLQNPSGGTPGQDTKRLLTDKEKAIWKQFHPHMTDDELNKMTVDNN